MKSNRYGKIEAFYKQLMAEDLIKTADEIDDMLAQIKHDRGEPEEEEEEYEPLGQLNLNIPIDEEGEKFVMPNTPDPFSQKYTEGVSIAQKCDVCHRITHPVKSNNTCPFCRKLFKRLQKLQKYTNDMNKIFRAVAQEKNLSLKIIKEIWDSNGVVPIPVDEEHIVRIPEPAQQRKMEDKLYYELNVEKKNKWRILDENGLPVQLPEEKKLYHSTIELAKKLRLTPEAFHKMIDDYNSEHSLTGKDEIRPAAAFGTGMADTNKEVKGGHLVVWNIRKIKPAIQERYEEVKKVIIPEENLPKLRAEKIHIELAIKEIAIQGQNFEKAKTELPALITKKEKFFKVVNLIRARMDEINKAQGDEKKLKQLENRWKTSVHSVQQKYESSKDFSLLRLEKEIITLKKQLEGMPKDVTEFKKKRDKIVEAHAAIQADITFIEDALKEGKLIEFSGMRPVRPEAVKPEKTATIKGLSKRADKKWFEEEEEEETEFPLSKKQLPLDLHEQVKRPRKSKKPLIDKSHTGNIGYLPGEKVEPEYSGVPKPSVLVPAPKSVRKQHPGVATMSISLVQRLTELKNKERRGILTEEEEFELSRLERQKRHEGWLWGPKQEGPPTKPEYIIEERLNALNKKRNETLTPEEQAEKAQLEEMITQEDVEGPVAQVIKQPISKEIGFVPKGSKIPVSLKLTLLRDKKEKGLLTEEEQEDLDYLEKVQEVKEEIVELKEEIRKLIRNPAMNKEKKLSLLEEKREKLQTLEDLVKFEDFDPEEGKKFKMRHKETPEGKDIDVDMEFPRTCPYKGCGTKLTADAEICHKCKSPVAENEIRLVVSRKIKVEDEVEEINPQTKVKELVMKKRVFPTHSLVTIKTDKEGNHVSAKCNKLSGSVTIGSKITEDYRFPAIKQIIDEKLETLKATLKSASIEEKEKIKEQIKKIKDNYDDLYEKFVKAQKLGNPWKQERKSRQTIGLPSKEPCKHCPYEVKLPLGEGEGCYDIQNALKYLANEDVSFGVNVTPYEEAHEVKPEEKDTFEKNQEKRLGNRFDTPIFNDDKTARFNRILDLYKKS